MVELREAFGDKVDRRGVFYGNSRSCGAREGLHLERVVMNKARPQWFRYILGDDTNVNGEGVEYKYRQVKHRDLITRWRQIYSDSEDHRLFLRTLLAGHRR